MAAYMIVYDLTSPERSADYQKLIDAIQQAFPTHWHFQQSAWIIGSNVGAHQIYSILSPYIDSNDKLLIVNLGRDAVWNVAQQVHSDWLKGVLS